MITEQELHSQIHRITELANVLNHLVSDRLICDTSITRDVFFDYMDLTKKHIEVHDREVFPVILSKGGDEARLRVKRCIDGTHEIKRMLDKYLKAWTNKRRDTLMIGDHATFVEDTADITELVHLRCEMETEQVYPLRREIRD